MVERPSGTVTFLFTDVEGSTRLWAEHPDEMRTALERHDEILRSAIEGRDGYVFSTAGDAFAAAFSRAGDAVAAAVEAQRALGFESWPGSAVVQVRMGLHTGEAQERDGDYFGTALNRAARIMGCGDGGQTLLSSITAGLVGSSDLVDLGHHRLKDLDEPEQLWQLGSGEFPALRSVSSTAHNLPSRPSRVYGRDSELGRIEGLLREDRLVTIVGPGGVGKTTVAVQVGDRLLDEFSDGVWLVDLAALSDPGLVATAVVEALGLHAEGSRAHLETARNYLASRQAMLVVDNCEHVIDEAAAVVGELLAGSPALRIVATSREPLHIEAEQIVNLAPLSVAGRDGADGPAVALFLERAAHAGREIVDESSRETVAAICSRLDGLPLAIELAAARVRSLSVREINDRLDQRFRLLTGGSRGALARHRTLEATISWSYDQLEAPIQELFDAASVFVGGFDLEAAVTVASGDEFDVLDGLDQLVDRSLVNVAHFDNGPTRYSMLESMRFFGRERLVERGTINEIRDRHLVWLKDITTAESPQVQMALPEAMARIDRELANIRVGLDWAANQGQTKIALVIVTAMGRYWYQRGITPEGAAWIERLRTSGPELEPATEALTLCELGFFLMQAGHAAQALDPLQRSLSLARQVGDPSLLTRTLHYTSRAGIGLHDPDELLGLIDEGHAIAINLGDELHSYLHSVTRVIWLILNADLDTALDVGWTYISEYRQTTSPHIAAHVEEMGAWLALLNRDTATAHQYLVNALQGIRNTANPSCGCHALESYAWWLASSGEHNAAASVLRAIDQIREAATYPRVAFESVPYRGVTEVLDQHQPNETQIPFDEVPAGLDLALEKLQAN